MSLTLNKREQERVKQRNRRKSDQDRKYNKLLQLKRVCKCAYGFCQGLKVQTFKCPCVKNSKLRSS